MHAHAESGMGAQNLSSNLHLHIGRSHQALYPGLCGERGRHLDIASALADIGEGATIWHATPDPVNLRSKLAREALLAAAIAGIRGRTPLGFCPGSGRNYRRGPSAGLGPGLETVLQEPAMDQAARGLGHIHKANPGPATRVLPSHFTGEPHELLLAGKSELEVNLGHG